MVTRRCALLLGTPGLPATAGAQEASLSRAIRILLGFTAGGPSDRVAWRFAERLTGSFRHPVAIENKAGASGTTAAFLTSVSVLPLQGISPEATREYMQAEFLTRRPLIQATGMTTD